MKVKLLPMMIILGCSFVLVNAQNITLPSESIGTLAPIKINYDGASGEEGSWIGLYPVGGGDGDYIIYQYIDASLSGELVFDGRTETGYFNFRMFSGPGYEKIFTSGPFLIKQGMFPDLTFQNKGIYTTDFALNDLDDYAIAISFAPGQRLVVAGSAKSGEVTNGGLEPVNIALARFLADGQLDPNFGQNGKLISDIPGYDIEQVNELVVQPDGKFIVGGSIYTEGGPCIGVSSFFLVRYLENGEFDSEFGENGLVVTNFTMPLEPAGFSSDHMTSMELQPDGKILTGGYGVLCGSGWGLPTRCNMARYLSNGQLDPQFGINGKLTFFTSDVNYPESYRERVDAIAPPENAVNGSIYVSVTSGDGNIVANRQLIYKFELTGSPDLSFGQDGVVVDARPGLNNDQFSKSIAIGPDNHLYIMGSTSGTGNIWLMKKNPVTGESAGDFGDNGFVIHNLPFGCQPAGMEFFNGIICIGHLTNGTYFSVTKFNLDGSQDVSFGTPGFENSESGNPVYSKINAFAMQSDGKYILAGGSHFYSTSLFDFVVMRFIDNPAQFEQHSHVVPLSTGWNGMSSYLNPAYNDVEAVVAPINQDFIILQNLSGSYHPSNNINNIQTWNAESGYWIKVLDATNLEISGFYPDQTTYWLQAGWNLISVLTNKPVEIHSVFGENIGLLELVKEAAGVGVFWPVMNIHSIQEFLPGKAYLVKMHEPCDITFD